LLEDVSAQKVLGRISVTETVSPILDYFVVDHTAGIYLGQRVKGKGMAVLFLTSPGGKSLLHEPVHAV
jgi:hypothetical protein